MRAVIRHLRAAALCCKGEGPTDGQLLDSFIIRREETAFEALVRRHGSMVLGVCRRVLRNVHDAEDAFQATFLVLSRKAATVKLRDMVGNWLYGVAYRTAMKSRAMRVKRQSRERQVVELSRVEAPAGGACEELLMQLDHELNRLPDRYRVPVVLCELEGRSRREVARLLGIPEGTLSSRLAQAKKLLARRLSRYGTVAVATLLAKSAASACLAPALRASTVKAVLSAGAVPAKVLALTEGMMKTMLLTKLKITLCAAALMVLGGVGATGLTYRAAAQQPRQETTLANLPQADDLEALRLEIEALRKSLQATRERVRSLEDEMRTLKRVDRNSARIMPGGMQPRAKTPPVGATREMAPARAGTQPGPNVSQDSSPASVAKPATESRPQTADLSFPIASPPRLENPAPRDSSVDTAVAPATESGPQAGNNPPATTASPFSMPRMPTTDPLANAEKALKKLRANPNDTKAIEALERALKRLKEREKPNVPSEGIR